MNRDQILKAFPLVEFLQARGVKLTNGGRRAHRCPIKEHSRPDTVSVDQGKGVWHCHSCGMGGTVVDWLAAEKGITVGEAFRELDAQIAPEGAVAKSKPSSTHGHKQNAATGNVEAKPRLVKAYDYTDEEGKLLFQCVRFEPKTFRQRRPDGAGDWVWSLSAGWFESSGRGWRKLPDGNDPARQPKVDARWFDAVRLVLYRLPDVVKASDVFIVEGEKDADTLAALDFCATCNPMGAGKWRDTLNESLRGKRVVIVPDNDETGRKHAAAVARALVGVAASVKVLTLPESVGGAAVKDGTDWINTFNDKTEAAERLATMADGAPEWREPQESRLKAAPTTPATGPATPAAAKPKPPLIELCAPSALKAYVPPEGIQLVGDWHVFQGSTFVIAGEAGVGKSRAAVGLAVAGATGQDWFGLKVHRPFRTLVVQTENGRVRLQNEVAELDCAALDAFVRITTEMPEGMAFHLPEFRDLLRESIEAFGADVVVVDPWVDVTRGMEKSEDFHLAFELVRQSLPTGDRAPALGIVAHTRKPRGDEKRGGRSMLNRLSGSYVLSSRPRCVWVLQAGSDDTEDDRVVWVCCKNSNGDMGKASAWRRRNGIFAPCDDFNWEAFWGNESTVGAKGKKVTADVLAELFADGPMSREDAVARLKADGVCGKSAAYDALKTDHKGIGTMFPELVEWKGQLQWRGLVGEEGGKG